MRYKIAALLDKTLTKILLAIALGFVAGAVTLAAAGYNPGKAYGMMFRSIFASPQNMVQVLVLTMPNILTGLSVAFAFKAGLFNIGGEGQYLIGAIVCVLAGGKLNLPPALGIPLIVLLGTAAGGLYGALSGYLKARFGIHEVLTTIMLNWIAYYFNNYLMVLPSVLVKDTQYSFPIRQGYWTNLLQGWKTSDAGVAYLRQHHALRSILYASDINWGIVVAVLAAVFVWFLLRRTTFGYQVRAVGYNREAAAYAGMNVKSKITMTMFTGGALCGLAGALQMTGTNPHALSTIAAMPGYGFNGITVALMANSLPIGCIFTALLLSALDFGGSTIQMNMGAPSEVVNIMIGTIVFFVAVASMFTMIAERLKAHRVAAGSPPGPAGGAGGKEAPHAR